MMFRFGFAPELALRTSNPYCPNPQLCLTSILYIGSCLAPIVGVSMKEPLPPIHQRIGFCHACLSAANSVQISHSLFVPEMRKRDSLHVCPRCVNGMSLPRHA